MRIAVFAYACEPGEGSEPGAGWTFARMLADLGETWVFTRMNNREAIERALPTTPERDRVRFVYVDLPQRLRGWKRGRRGIHLYYLIWMFIALGRARTMHRELHFDLAWHATFANAWLGSTAALLPIPFVYGPVGGGVKVPLRLAPALGAKGVLFELTRSTARGVSRYLNPLARATWNRAALILVQNRETRAWFPRRHRQKAHVFPNVVMDPILATGERPRTVGRTALFAGRLIPWKGASLAVRALVHLPGWTLVIAGEGDSEASLRVLASRCDVAARVRFLGQVPRVQLQEWMQREARVLLFPSMREEAGWVVGEALVAGLPVVCLDRGGPPVIGGTPVKAGGVKETSRDLAKQVLMIDGHEARRGPDLSLAARRLELEGILQRAGLLSHDGAEPETDSGESNAPGVGVGLRRRAGEGTKGGGAA